MMHDWSTGDDGGQVPGSAERLHLAVLGQDPHCWTSAVSAFLSHSLCYTVHFSLILFVIRCILVSFSSCYTIDFSLILFVIQCISVSLSLVYNAFQLHSLCYTVHLSRMLSFVIQCISVPVLVSPLVYSAFLSQS